MQALTVGAGGTVTPASMAVSRYGGLIWWPDLIQYKRLHCGHPISGDVFTQRLKLLAPLHLPAWPRAAAVA